MTQDWFLQAIAVGVLATLVMDIWAWIQFKLLAIPSLNYAWVGRWLIAMKDGKFVHKNIIQSKPEKGEVILGWFMHYLIGVVFSIAYLYIGQVLTISPMSLTYALLFGLVTVIYPFYLMQPAFGFGFAASKTPAPWVARFRSMVAHLSFGLGLYLAAILVFN